MKPFQPSPLGILKCRDLCTLYYGFPMVGEFTDRAIQDVLTNQFKILGQDPRRIAYQLSFANGDPAPQFVIVGKQPEIDTGNGILYWVLPGDTRVIERSFFTDLDAVCSEIWGMCSSAQFSVGVRETFLTPAPVDEVPLP